MRALRLSAASMLLACGTGEVPPVPAPSVDVGVAVAPAGRRFRTEPIFHDGVLVVPRATVCVPPGVNASTPLPLLYALDGDYFVDDLALCDVVAELVGSGAIPPWVVVSVGSTERRTEMLAAHPEQLARVVIEELEPMVRAEVALAAGPENRAVLGYSYGGLAAVRFALARPGDFGRVIAMSPSLWYAHRAALDAFEHAPLPVRLYVDAGAREGDEGEVVPYMIDDARALVGIARSRGMQFGRDVALREVPRTGHDMALAAVRLAGALRFVLGDAFSPAEVPTAVAIDVFERVTPRTPTTFSIDATYGTGVVLSWPIDLAHARLAGAPLEDARLPPLATGLEVEVAGVRAIWP